MHKSPKCVFSTKSLTKWRKKADNPKCEQVLNAPRSSSWAVFPACPRHYMRICNGSGTDVHERRVSNAENKCKASVRRITKTKLFHTALLFTLPCYGTIPACP